MKTLLAFLLLSVAAFGAGQCPNQAAISYSSTSGSVEIAPLSAGKRVVICFVSFSHDTASVNVKFVQGTGTNCGTGATDISGAHGSTQSGVFSFVEPLTGLVGRAVCLNFSATVTGGGLIKYGYE